MFLWYVEHLHVCIRSPTLFRPDRAVFPSLALHSSWKFSLSLSSIPVYKIFHRNTESPNILVYKGPLEVIESSQLLCRAAPQAAGPQPATVQGLVLAHVQDLAFGSVVLHKIPVSPFLYLVQVGEG